MQSVEVKVVDNVATIVMDRAEKRNALDRRLTSELGQAFSDLHQQKNVAAVVISGKGQDFCSGIDLAMLGDIAEMNPVEAQGEWIAVWTELTELCETILRFPKPVVAAVDGHAIGAGLALALATDLVVLSRTARLSANAAARGLIGGVTAPLLSFRFGASIAARMLLTASAIEADEAHRLGMCCEVVESDQVWVAANGWAKRCTAGPHESVLATKRMLNENIGETLLTHLASGAITGATLCSTESASEGIRAFVEKRDPEWP
ncbi:MAG: enoyl-CoA hydratase/isomerase family protein [Planctomycetota bacterium]